MTKREARQGERRVFEGIDAGRRRRNYAKQQRRRTPIAFAEWLISLAQTATAPHVAEKE